MKKTGLTIGKYAPLHKGHQFLIETALSEVEHLYVIIYLASDSTDIPIHIRHEWVSRFYPEVTVIEALHVPTDKGYTLEIQKKHVDYILSLLDGIKIDAFYSSEPYGKLMSEALGCENRVVDIRREQIAISATEIRKNPTLYKNFMEPSVYEDLMCL